MIKLVLKKNVAEIQLARPQQRNALTLEMLRELRNKLEEITLLDDIRVVTLTAQGDHFCAGADIEWMKASAALSMEKNEKEAKELFDLLYAIVTFPKPVVAQLKGAVYGGGVGLAAAADIVLADETTLFCLSEVKLGLTPSMISPFVIQKIGYSWFKLCSLTAQTFSAQEGVNMGLIHQLIPAKNFSEQCEHIIAALQKNAPYAMAECKMLTQFIFEQHHWNIFANEMPKHIAKTRVGAEAQEGLKAFMNKTKPSWVKA